MHVKHCPKSSINLDQIKIRCPVLSHCISIFNTSENINEMLKSTQLCLFRLKSGILIMSFHSDTSTAINPQSRKNLVFSNHLIPFHLCLTFQDSCNYTSQPKRCIKWSAQTILISFLLVYLLLLYLHHFMVIFISHSPSQHFHPAA